jgi:hypothetical protein
MRPRQDAPITTPGNDSLDGGDIPVVAKRGCSGRHCPTWYDAKTDQHPVQRNAVAAEIAVRPGLPPDETPG